MHHRVWLETVPAELEDEVTDVERRGIFTVPGVLMEFIKGSPLSRMFEDVPKASWGIVAQQGMEIASKLSESPHVLFPAFGSHKLLVSPHPSGVPDRYRVVLVGFGGCQVRGKDESDASWGRRKHDADERNRVWKELDQEINQRNLGLVIDAKPRATTWSQYATAPKVELAPRLNAEVPQQPASDDAQTRENGDSQWETTDSGLESGGSCSLQVEADIDAPTNPRTSSVRRKWMAIRGKMMAIRKKLSSMGKTLVRRKQEVIHPQGDGPRSRPHATTAPSPRSGRRLSSPEAEIASS